MGYVSMPNSAALSGVLQIYSVSGGQQELQLLFRRLGQ
jgi:hypothetical protein